MKIIIESIPHNEHRYPTVGDYYTQPDGTEIIKVSALPDWRYEFLIAFHELIEDFLCQQRGIKEPDIKAFDEMFEAERLEGKHSDEAEPGFDPRAPYRKEHSFATAMERLMALELGADWDAYEKAIMELP